MIGLDSEASELETWGGGGGLSAEMSSPRLLPRRTPSAAANSVALERANQARRSLDRSEPKPWGPEAKSSTALIRESKIPNPKS